MSAVQLQGNASGTGTFTISSPNSNSNRALALPDADTTLVGTDATQTLSNKTLSGNINMTGGTKYQVSGVATNALAWANFNGTTGARKSSHNVSSVTVVSTGRYTVNLTSALADADYSVQITNQQNATTNYSSNIGGLSPTTTSFEMYHFEGGSVSYPATNSSIYIAVFGN